MPSVLIVAGKNQSKPPATPNARGEAKDAVPAVRVLVVEDEAITAMGLELVLETLGYEVCGFAADAQEAVRQAASTTPDLILMDIRLANGSDGVQAAAEIRARHGIRSLFLTAHNDPATLERARNVSPFGILTKPYTRVQLGAALAAATRELRGDP